MNNPKAIHDFILELQKEAQLEFEKVQDDTELKNLQKVAELYDGADKLVSSKEIADKLRNRKETPHFKTGIKPLDDILTGFYPEQLVVVSAITKHGKTSFCIDLTAKLREQNPLWLPFEESAEELVQKFLDRGEEPPHFYTPNQMKGDNLQWVEKKIIEGIAKFGSQVVFIDQLDFLVPFGADNHALRVGQAMRELKRMAKTWKVVIVLICHLVKTELSTQPTLEDLKGSSSIGQEADTVLLLWRETKRENGQVVITNNVNVSVQANRRHGKTGNIKMVYSNGKFLEQEWQQSQKKDDWGGL